MRSSLYAVSIAMMLAACGGGDDGKSVALVDASTTKKDSSTPGTDSGTTNTDGGTNTNPAAQGLGKVCKAATDCPTNYQCTALSQTATQGFCVNSCGTSTATDPSMAQPPSTGDAMCKADTPPPGSGTPLCAIQDGKTPTQTWYCAVACGTLSGMDLGTCPGGLTCTDNICQ